MPTYEYACLSCGQHVEVYQRFSDEPLTVCGVCEGPLRKVFHPAGILFKGSGFYVTDSRAGRSGSKDGDAGRADQTKKDGAKSDAGGPSPKPPSSTSRTNESVGSKERPYCA